VRIEEKKCRVTVGIPAYNEEHYLSRLLPQLRSQKVSGQIELAQILVCSDGSSDDTEKTVENFARLDGRFEVHHRSVRLGQTATISEIFQRAGGDIIVLLDADVTLPDHRTIERLVLPLISSKAAISAANVFALPPHSLVERAAVFSANLRKHIESLRPIYALHCAYAVSRKFWDSALPVLPNNLISADAYLFLLALQKGLAATFSSAVVYYPEQNTLSAFLNQRRRHDYACKQLEQVFGKFAVQQMHIPVKALTSGFLKTLVFDLRGGFLWLMLRMTARVLRRPMPHLYRDR